MSANLKHFLRLALRGKPNTGASSGELQARRLALCIVGNALGLDESASDGLVDFIRLTQSNPEQARNLIDGWDEA